MRRETAAISPIAEIIVAIRAGELDAGRTVAIYDRSVRDALVARGMAAGSITADARGETDLAQPTRDGVREPLNRRTAVTISFR